MAPERLRILCAAGLLTALSFVVMIIQIPFPLLPTYKYDFADVPALIGTFTLGPTPAVGIVLCRNILHNFLIKPNPIGHVMNFFASGMLVLVAGVAYMREHSHLGAVWALVLGVLAQTLIMVPLNLVVLPYYLGLPMEKAVAMLLSFTIPFNLSKGIISAVCTYLLYKKVSPRLPHYMQVDRGPLHANGMFAAKEEATK